MTNDKVEVFFLSGYTGTPKCEARIDGKEYVIELDEIERLLANIIKINGYKTTKTNRQKYPRLVIN